MFINVVFYEYETIEVNFKYLMNKVLLQAKWKRFKIMNVLKMVRLTCMRVFSQSSRKYIGENLLNIANLTKDRSGR